MCTCACPNPSCDMPEADVPRDPTITRFFFCLPSCRATDADCGHPLCVLHGVPGFCFFISSLILCFAHFSCLTLRVTTVLQALAAFTG